MKNLIFKTAATFSIISVEPFKELWHNQPTTVIGVGVSIAVLLGIYIFLLNTYK